MLVPEKQRIAKAIQEEFLLINFDDIQAEDMDKLSLIRMQLAILFEADFCFSSEDLKKEEESINQQPLGERPKLNPYYKRLSPEQKDEIYKLKKEGMSFRTLGEKFKVHPSAIYHVCKNYRGELARRKGSSQA